MKANTCELGQYTLAQLPKGEFIRLGNSQTVYVKGDYDRTSRKYELTRFDDISRTTFKRGDTFVTAGFSF